MTTRGSAILMFAAAALVGGCVTAHEGSVPLVVSDHIDGGKIPDVYVLKIFSRGVEKTGHWWVAEREQSGPAVPQSAEALLLSREQKLHQEGTNITLFGPYAYGHSASWEYWAFRPGYDPQRFYDSHLERAYKKQKPLEITLSRVTPGSAYSDEKVLDAARRIESIADLLPPGDSTAGAVLQILTRQLHGVSVNAWKAEDRQEADRLLSTLAAMQEHYPPPQNALLTPLPEASAETASTAEPTAHPAAVKPQPIADDAPQGDSPKPVSLDDLVPPSAPEHDPVPIRLEPPPTD